MRKLTKQEKSIISRLHKLNENWSETLILIADMDGLFIVDVETGRVLDDNFSNIKYDGGFCNHIYDDDGNEFIET